MERLKYLDSTVVFVGILILIVAKQEATTWGSTLVTAFAGMLIGSALTRMAIRFDKARKGIHGKKS